MEINDIIVLCSFDTFMDEGNDSAIEQQRKLFESLKRINKQNEILFNRFVGVYHHDRRLKPEKYYVPYLEDEVVMPSVPCVVFINLSNNGKRIDSEISFLKKYLPCAVFVLFGSDTELGRCIKEVSTDEAEEFRKFYRLTKNHSGDSIEFDKEVREILNVAEKTSLDKINVFPRFFSVFISYSHKDKEFANWIFKNLNSYGVKCWLDEKRILPGDKIHIEVDKAITKTDKIMLIASEHSLTSWWVDNEINLCINKEKKMWSEFGNENNVLIPINLDNYIFSPKWENGWKGQITSRFAPDFSQWSEYNLIREKGEYQTNNEIFDKMYQMGRNIDNELNKVRAALINRNKST